MNYSYCNSRRKSIESVIIIVFSSREIAYELYSEFRNCGGNLFIEVFEILIGAFREFEPAFGIFFELIV